ncbi:MAG: HD domain-containing protein, partial [Bdellovibrionales bacterium]|nr:HD domain-containing protein [Bdellovibrionales bacterium]
MSVVTFADVAHPAVTFNTSLPEEELIVQLIDTRWFQRLRDISQTANTRLVYMFSEHSRFGHSIGVAYLAKLVLNSLSDRHKAAVDPYRCAVLAAALLHDIGHVAPGSHTAYKTWFPNAGDIHEELGCRILQEDPEIVELLSHSAVPPNLLQLVLKILTASEDVPAWTWEIISGGGWNV